METDITVLLKNLKKYVDPYAILRDLTSHGFKLPYNTMPEFINISFTTPDYFTIEYGYDRQPTQYVKAKWGDDEKRFIQV